MTRRPVFRRILSAAAASPARAVASLARAARSARAAVSRLAPPPAALHPIGTPATRLLAELAPDWPSAVRAYAAASDDDPIAAPMIAMASWSMPIALYVARPNHYVIAGCEIGDPAGPIYRTITDVTGFPATKGEFHRTTLISARAMMTPPHPSGELGATVAALASVLITIGPAL